MEEKQAKLEEQAKKEKKELQSAVKYLKQQVAHHFLIPEGSSLKEEGKSMKFYSKQGKNTLISSTLPFFVKHILDPQVSNYSPLAFGLFLHHPLFIKADELLEALLLRWRDKQGESGEVAGKERER